MSKLPRYVDVAPAVPLSASARALYTYRLRPVDVAEDLVFRAVEVPFGGRIVRGIIMAVRDQAPPFPTQTLRRLWSVKLTDQQVEFGQWIAHTMQGGIGFTLRMFLPPRL